MKISQLIAQLEYLKEKHGDNDLHLTIKDHYSRYGVSGHFHYSPDRPTEQPWEGTFTNGSNTTLFISIDEEEGKYPKVTFRKP